MLSGKEIQLKRVQEIIREIVPEASCDITTDEQAIVCGIYKPGVPLTVRFDLFGPTYDRLLRHGYDLKSKMIGTSGLITIKICDLASSEPLLVALQAQEYKPA